MSCPYCNSEKIEKYLTVTHTWYDSDTTIYDGNQYDYATEDWVQCKECKKIYLDVNCYNVVKRIGIKEEDAESDNWGLLSSDKYVMMPDYFQTK